MAIRKINPPSKLEQATNARLQEIRDVARSGVTEYTGKSARFHSKEGGEERGRRIGGMRSSFTELERLPTSYSPKRIAEAIERGKGVVFQAVRGAVRREMEKFYAPPKVRRESPTVSPHSRITRKCKTCNVVHGKGAHRFHGKGAYHQTHLFSFNPGFAKAGARIKINGRYSARRKTVQRMQPNPASRPVKIYGNVTRIYLKGGSYALARKPKMYGLPDGDLWITWGNGTTPRNAAIDRRYGRVSKIEAQKTQRHLCDAKCKEMKHQYYHPFTEPNEMMQLRDGSLLISSR